MGKSIAPMPSVNVGEKGIIYFQNYVYFKPSVK